MEGTWPVQFQEKKVGVCTVTSAGLYYKLCCRCVVAEKGLFQLYWGQENLGLLAPEGGELVLQTSQPMKRFPGGSPIFTIQKRRQRSQGMFVPLSPTEPFRYLSQLEHARLEKKNGVLGVTIWNTGDYNIS